MRNKVFYIAEVDGDTSFQDQTLEIKTYRRYILVNGVNYPHSIEDSISSFKIQTDNYMKKIIKNREKGSYIIICYIDILNGTITEIEYSDNDVNGKELSKQIFSVIQKKDYKEIEGRIRFTNNKNIISKNTIYEQVKKIGIEDPCSLVEISIFSHAYWKGPILLNTEEGEDDCDMRIDDTEYLSTDDDFLRAFSQDSIFKIWGCSFPPTTNALYSIFRRKGALNPMLDDTQIFTFAANTFYYYNDRYGTRTELMPDINNALKTDYKVTAIIKLSFAEIKKILAFNYIAMYASLMAKNCNIKVQAALPATYSSTYPYFHIADTVLGNVKAYKEIFNVSIGEFNFGIFDKETVERLTNLYYSLK
nr:hypothetical protein [uncultured Capnocytophaga sp.]